MNRPAGDRSASRISDILALAKRAESRDAGAGRHVDRVGLFCKLFALHLSSLPRYGRRITDDFIENLSQAAALHDIGKADIEDRILLKPGRLTPDEFEVMKAHSLLGWRKLETVHRQQPGNTLIKMGMCIACHHHERWDGSGYPEKLAGEVIPLEARITAVADVYDVLRSKRVYKEPFSHEQSVRIIVAGKGTHFDPDMIDAFTCIADTFDMVYNWIPD